jgi:NADH pyrophosphatase NudC (nudix superfamily)
MSSTYEGVLGRQSFAGSDLIRGEPKITTDGAGFGTDTYVAFMLDKKICVQEGTREGQYIVAWQCIQDLFKDGVFSPANDGTQEFIYHHDSIIPSSPPTEVPLYYLGYIETESRSLDMRKGSYYVCDMTPFQKQRHEYYQGGKDSARASNRDSSNNGRIGFIEKYMDLRTLLPQLRRDHAAYAGRAVALTQWHQNHQFCAKCGSATKSIVKGAKRQCLGNPLHKHYPRTDPVIITLVVLDTVDNPSMNMITKERALVGRSKNLPPGTLTCLSGFIDQGESIEEAVAREVKEESGVIVHSVEILGSQPWPIGRGGSCELMIGCIARTTSEILNVDFNEMAECRWVTKEEVLEALKNSLSPESPFISRRARGGEGAPGGGDGGAPGLAHGEGVQGSTTNGKNNSSALFYVPPPYAIAHHLLKYWAENKVESRSIPPQSNM